MARDGYDRWDSGHRDSPIHTDSRRNRQMERKGLVWGRDMIFLGRRYEDGRRQCSMVCGWWRAQPPTSQHRENHDYSSATLCAQILAVFEADRRWPPTVARDRHAAYMPRLIRFCQRRRQLLRLTVLCAILQVLLLRYVGVFSTSRERTMPPEQSAHEVATSLLANHGLSLQSLEVLQSLWAGYGQICRVTATQMRRPNHQVQHQEQPPPRHLARRLRKESTPTY
jgi:hypothetical protein